MLHHPALLLRVGGRVGRKDTTLGDRRDAGRVRDATVSSLKQDSLTESIHDGNGEGRQRV
jgi:hypothetical protein